MQDPTLSANDLVSTLKKRIHSQENAIHTVAMTLQSIPLFENKTVPIACFLFVGKNGVGKKLLTTQLAKCLFPNQPALIEIAHQPTPTTWLDLLIRSNTNEKKSLYNAILQNPRTIVFFEDIHENFHSVSFLNEMFCNPIFRQTIFVISTTLGSELLSSKTNSSTSKTAVLDLMQLVLNDNPLLSTNKSKDDTQEKILNTLKTFFSTNLLRQLQLVSFNPLDHLAIEKILQLKLRQLADTLEKKFQTEFQYAPEILRYLTHIIEKQNDDTQSIDKIFETAVCQGIAHTLFSYIAPPLQKKKIYLSMHDSGQLLKSEIITSTQSMATKEYY